PLRQRTSHRRRRRTPDGEKLLPLANVAAVALENARLAEEMEREIGERKSAEDRLRRSVEEKEVLAQEIHHRVKNNLAMVLSIINLQMGEHPGETDVNQSFEELQKRIRAIAAVHEQLHQSGNLSAIHLPTYLQEIVDGLSQSGSARALGVDIRADVADITVSPNESVPIGLLVTEAVTNALKHAFPEGRSGWITVMLRGRPAEHDARQAELIIEDTGVGLTGGEAEEASDSLGMLLLHSLAEQLRGTITVGGEDGTRIQVLFPLPAD
ncbi:MAG: sensor histidine kinase, partial [bacterium]